MKRSDSARNASWRYFKSARPAMSWGLARSGFRRRSPLPGTSTIQTRLRYMLFIPWLYRDLESATFPRRSCALRRAPPRSGLPTP
ncbi:DUF6361 family protein [Paracoccus marcusii]|uniref:DUF6361 family protein n=1 Tax=Paracoccus marcusii TaxID=59779 RepID=UPI0039C891D2